MTRLKALDVMRGLTIALMILVNTALWGTPIFSPLKHSLWNGMAAADIVFPLFMFMMGVSMAFSLKKFDYRPNRKAVSKIVKRTVMIYLVGILLDCTEKAISGTFSIDTLRFTGVLPRLALSYGFAAVFALCFSKKTIQSPTEARPGNKRG
ncbi:MAG: heparan-alpha-glucosaminide N-acetyltransferase domain-containing protein [Bacteroides sp.]|nr:heparan-alpha-glucosaminide N-acetyltransferase domain-containing protein [Bacteroides sp.]MCM1379881.1 heparan-alpha-glucosaminide N-acetyltransferase domain-containing protein [Bacteroides sp.]MCM1446265.1 heparan-alpha-glucosaminide N-acetyltransferase domain-containing protein [Prevotella sp.]